MEMEFNPQTVALSLPPLMTTKLTASLLETLLTMSSADNIILDFPHGIVIANLKKETKQ